MVPFVPLPAAMATALKVLVASLSTLLDAGVSPPLSIESTVTQGQVQLGEPLTVAIVITHTAEQRYELLPPGDLGAFEYVEQKRERVDEPEHSTTTIRVTLQAFELGKQRTPTLELELTDPKGVSKMPVSGTEVEVVSTLPQDAQAAGASLYDIRKPEELPVRTYRLLWVLVAGLLTALMALALARLLKRRATNVTPPPRVLEPAHIRATAALDALAADNLPGQGRTKEFYFRLSEIIRGYLGEIYRFEALESTTPELLEALSARPTPGLPLPELTEFANQSDFVRYAKLDPGPADCQVALQLGYRIVHATAQALVTPPAGVSQP
jgi:hypothetical protein